MQTKRCTKCGTEKPHDQFSKRKSAKDGLKPHCVACVAQYNKEHSEHNSARDRNYVVANYDLVILRRKKYYLANREKRAIRDAEYYIANRSEINTRNAQWAKDNPDKRQASHAKRRAVNLQATPPWLTKDDFAAIQLFYTISNQLTELNGRIYHVDHIVPLQGKTVCGLHVPWNLQILDGPENLAKSNKLVLPAEMLWN